MSVAELMKETNISSRHTMYETLGKLVKEGAIIRVLERTSSSNILKHIYYYNKKFSEEKEVLFHGNKLVQSDGH